ncbi:flagellar protein FlgN [Pararhodospirillum photometricum]|nr:flagellar protein FlgN [Pararhodospirillum photometricum]
MGRLVRGAATEAPARPRPSRSGGPGKPEDDGEAPVLRQAAAALPGQVDSKVLGLHAAMQQLVEILVTENKALANHDFTTVQSLTETKIARTRRYQELMDGIKNSPRVLLELNNEQRGVLRTLGETLDGLARENARRLKANIEASNHLLRSVAEAVRDQQRDNAPAYSAEGMVNGPAASGRQTSVSVNELL